MGNLVFYMDGHTPHVLEHFPVFVESRDSIIHYSCNAPSKIILDKYNIKQLGENFGCFNTREVLEIPLKVYQKAVFFETKDKDVLQLNLEKLMRDLK